jgi:hypothetical protein
MFDFFFAFILSPEAIFYNVNRHLSICCVAVGNECPVARKPSLIRGNNFAYGT